MSNVGGKLCASIYWCFVKKSLLNLVDLIKDTEILLMGVSFRVMAIWLVVPGGITRSPVGWTGQTKGTLERRA